MLWNRQRFLDALPSEYKAELQERPGGDCDLLALHVAAKDGSMGDDVITVTPLVPPDKTVQDPAADEDILAVEVRNFQSDSRGGCRTENNSVANVYTVVKQILVQQGYFVVDHYDEIY